VGGKRGRPSGKGRQEEFSKSKPQGRQEGCDKVQTTVKRVNVRQPGKAMVSGAKGGENMINGTARAEEAKKKPGDRLFVTKRGKRTVKIRAEKTGVGVCSGGGPRRSQK